MAPNASLFNDLFSTALLHGDFTLRSGAKTDRYFDKYRVTCTPDLLNQITRELAKLIVNKLPKVSGFVAPELGAVPLATALSLELNIPFVIVRSTSKGYGSKNKIEGNALAIGKEAVLIEDVVTSGSAALEAIDVARDLGINLTTSFCILDRGAGGKEALDKAETPLFSLFNQKDLDKAFDQGLGIRV